MNPHALRHWILSPARLPFRHSRAELKGIGKQWLFEGQGDHCSAEKPNLGVVLNGWSLLVAVVEHFVLNVVRASEKLTLRRIGHDAREQECAGLLLRDGAEERMVHDHLERRRAAHKVGR